MAIVNRITRLFTADVHAVLDRIEEPDALLRQAIREMESALAELSSRVKGLELDCEQVRCRSADIERALVTVAEELDLSFAAGNDGLVRRCLRRRIEGERLLRQLEQRQTTLTREIEQYTPLLEQQRERLHAMRQKAALFDVEVAACAGADSRWNADDICVSEADIDLALLREQQARRAS